DYYCSAWDGTLTALLF
nr:immunoglobulin light chain junction region [Macaca mulatta]